jgi:hypothetical protein
MSIFEFELRRESIRYTLSIIASVGTLMTWLEDSSVRVILCANSAHYVRCGLKVEAYLLVRRLAMSAEGLA